ncbi:MAG: hypothetical protein JWN98_536, partial [Abditibacteriota bacterium]|nr:hypothetical protein [Abditibacteriota bacterium]
GGEAAHKIGDDHDDVNVETGSGGDLGKNAGAGAGSISGAIVGGSAAGPLGAVAGAVGGGMLGAAAGDGAKDMGGADDSTSSGTGTDVTPGNNVPGVQTGGVTTTGTDDNTGGRVI